MMNEIQTKPATKTTTKSTTGNAIHTDSDDGTSIVDISVLAKTDYRATAFHLYMLLTFFAEDNSRYVNVSIEKLAFYAARTQRTIKRWLKFLEENGIIEQKSHDTFIIHDGYRDSLEA